jgi:hypothetical protein
MRWVMLALCGVVFLGTGCVSGDRLRRGEHEFPPKVPKGAADGAYATRKGFVVMRGGVAWRFEF